MSYQNYSEYTAVCATFGLLPEITPQAFAKEVLDCQAADKRIAEQFAKRGPKKDVSMARRKFVAIITAA